MPLTNRRTFLLASAASAVSAPFVSSLASAAGRPTDDLAAQLRNPPASSRPQIRWWWPGGTIEPGEVRREAAAIAEAGFGGFEIADVRDSVTLPIDPKTQGWGTPAWRAGVEAALEEAVRHGISPSLTLGPHWPTGLPGVQPDDDAASKELVHGLAEVAGGERFVGLVPGPVQVRPSGALDKQNEHPPVTPVLLAVQALRVDETASEGPRQLDPASLIDLTGEVQGDRLDWRAPAAGQWLILSFWMRGTGQIQNMFGMNKTASMLADPIPYVLDIYGPAAVKALTRYWDEHLLTARTRALLRKAGGTFFEDSLELSFACPWTPSALEEFARRRGYRLEPYLALIVSRQPSFDEMILGGGRPLLFRQVGVDAARVRHDFDSLLSELYVENRLKGLARWSAKQGMKFRVQAIGSEINAGHAAAFAPIPEGDNSNDIHGWRKLAAGRDIGGGKILSDEAATFVKGIAHVATWRDALYMLQRDMAGGANQIVLHGFSYADAPGATWPGFSAFGRAIGNDWGPRDPNWTMAGGITAYLGRLQHLLRQGRTRADLAVLGKPLASQSVLHAGYTFQYPDMGLLLQPQMALSGGRLMPQGPGYRALVINGLDEIDLTVAQKLNDHASVGFPVVVVGDAPLRGRGWKDASDADAKIALAMRSLLAAHSVRQVASQKDVPLALAGLGVHSELNFAEPVRALALRRSIPEGELLYLLNDTSDPVDTTLAFGIAGFAHQIDLWSGAIVARTEGNNPARSPSVALKLAPNEPAVFLIAPQPLQEAERRTEALGGPVAELGDWEVMLDSWQPGPTPLTTSHQTQVMHIGQLAAWSKLPGQKGMAGTARYRALLVVGAGRSLADAELDLGAVGGTASVSINGAPHQVVNPFTSRVRIGRWLKTGKNFVEIVVASPLNNRLLAEGIGEQGFKPPVDADPAKAPPPPPIPVGPSDPDLKDGPSGMAGMQPGAAPPGSQRQYHDYGLLGPVRLRLT